MVLREVWVISRNAWNRPTVGHLLVDGQASATRCGRDTSGWSRSFIPGAAVGPLAGVLCLACCRATSRRDLRMIA